MYANAYCFPRNALIVGTPAESIPCARVVAESEKVCNLRLHDAVPIESCRLPKGRFEDRQIAGIEKGSKRFRYAWLGDRTASCCTRLATHWIAREFSETWREEL